MASGAWLPDVRFDAVLRKELSGHLHRYDAAAIISDLQHVVEILPAFRRGPRRQSVRRTLDELKTAAAHLKELLRQLDEETEEYLHNALALRRQKPTELRSRLIELLDVFDDAIDEADEMVQPRARGGRPRDLEATWLVAQVADTLKRHGVKVTTHEDGVCAKVLRTLWPYALPKREAPLELKPWFKLLKSQQ